MPVNVSASWDEGSSLGLLGCCWSAIQFTFLLVGFLVKIHLLHSTALMRFESPLWVRIPGYLVYLLVMITGALYLNLIVNGIWHKNPDISEPFAKLFEQSVLKNPAPIIRRDKIQWIWSFPGRRHFSQGTISTQLLPAAALGLRLFS